MIQTIEKWDSLDFNRPEFWMVWRWHSIPCCHFFVAVWKKRWKEHLGENNLCHGYGNYFKSAILKVTWYQFFRSSQQLRDTLTTAFERHPTV